jgi:ribonuclease HII
MVMADKRAERMNELLRTDRVLWQSETVFAGIDEAGRGPLAGHVLAACVVMPPDKLLMGVDDSKKLSENRRDAVYDEIIAAALYVGVGDASAEEIDRLNILNAAKLAMRRAARNVPARLFAVDAVTNVGLHGRELPIVHGDAVCYSIAAASIIAKVLRDRRMRQLHTLYPMYGFDRNKGYGTPEHMRMLRIYGPCPEHRRVFIRKLLV